MTTGRRVSQLQLDQIADHAFALGTENIERILAILRARIGLQGQQPDLRAVAVCDHQLMARAQQGSKCGYGPAHVSTLRLGRHRLTAPQQRIASQSGHDAHRRHDPIVATSSALIVCIRFSA